MAKLVDALDLGSSGATHKSSSLFMPTNINDGVATITVGDKANEQGWYFIYCTGALYRFLG